MGDEGGDYGNGVIGVVAGERREGDMMGCLKIEMEREVLWTDLVGG